MPSLKEVRNKIASVSSTMQITSAMKMVSAAKLRRAQDAIVQMRPYAAKLKEILDNASEGMPVYENPYARNTAVKNVLIIAVTSNRGLAGAFNSNIIKKVNEVIREQYQGKNITVLPVGKKAQDAFKKTNYIIGGLDLPHHAGEIFNNLNFDAAAPIVEKIMDAFIEKQFDKVVVVYNRFRNAAVQYATVEQLLPVGADSAAENKPSEKEKGFLPNYIFEPEQEQIINDIIPVSVKIQFYKALIY
jgi:F-type H+-transporting ATPase subunit gamma